MSFLTRILKQTCVYWGLDTEDPYDDEGFPNLIAGAELSCRWVDKSEEFINTQGARQLSKSRVLVASDVVPGGVLMLGDLDDVTDLVNIKENSGAWEIARFDKIPNFRATEFVRVAWL